MARGADRDPYRILGIDRDANQDAIKNAYRKAAQKYHPDVNPDDPKAEERFKDVSAAYAVLSDVQRRKDYDQFGEIALDPNFDAEAARRAQAAFGGRASGGGPVFDSTFQDFEAQGLGGLGSLFEELMGARGQSRVRRRRRGADFESTLELDFLKAALGGDHRLRVTRPDKQGSLRQETLTLDVPVGVAEGSRIRLAGKGAPGHEGGPPGDLYATVHVLPHPVFTRRDRDILLDVPVTVAEAVLGAEVEVPTLEGRAKVQIPPGTDGGTKLRLRGKGVPAAGGKPAGDLYVTVRIAVPKKLSEETREQFEQLSDLGPADPRAHLFR